MIPVIMGAIAMGFAVIALFFLRFWREMHDRLFGFFAAAFFILAVNRVGLALTANRENEGDYLYWIRFAAFAVILIAIWDKNRVRGK